MRLSQLRSFPDASLGELHYRQGDAEIVASRPEGVSVVFRFVGDGWLMVWRDVSGEARTKLVRSESELWRCVHRLTRYGCLPWRPRTSKTLRGLRAVGG